MFELAVIVAVVMALTEFVKRMEIINNKYLPAISLVLGIVAGIFYVGGTAQEQIMYGLMIGLSAAGLFDQTKIIKK
ncbi:holin [Robertmurraya massiliosenegalensis]|uniref:holin n=1 Tax=Robertmurraya TaxID=2837507 RepID=UPI0039A61CEA